MSRPSRPPAPRRGSFRWGVRAAAGTLAGWLALAAGAPGGGKPPEAIAVAAAAGRSGTPVSPAEVVQAAWEAIGRLYFDPKMAGIDWEALLPRYLQQARAGADGYALAREMLGLLGPDAGSVLTPEQAAEARERGARERVVGIGVVIVRLEDGGVLVRSVLPGGAAEQRGVRRGDRILAVDGASTAGMTLDQVAGAIRGQPGTTVVLQLQAPDGSSRRLELVRQPYTYEPRVRARVLEGQIGYLYLPHFQPGMETAFLGELRRLYRTRALVLDLRDSVPGGSLATLSHVAGLLLREPLGLLIGREDVTVLPAQKATRSDNPLIPAPTDLDFYDRPMAVLIDETSRFHELAFALKEHRRAVLVGRPLPSGGGQIQTCSQLPGGGEVCVTSLRFFSTRGRPLAGPVVPDVVVPLDGAFLQRWAAGGDPDLEKALDILSR